MKKFRSAILVVLAVAVVFTMFGCGGRKDVDWEMIKSNDTVLTANDVSITRRVVDFCHAMDVYIRDNYSSSFTEALNLEGYEQREITKEDSLNEVVGYAVLQAQAQEMGLAMSYEEAYDIAYDEFVINPKMAGNEQYKAYKEGILETLNISQNMLVEYAAAYTQMVQSAYAITKHWFLELESQYEDEEELEAAVLEKLQENAKDIDVTLYGPEAQKLNVKDVDMSVTMSYVSSTYMY